MSLNTGRLKESTEISCGKKVIGNAWNVRQDADWALVQLEHAILNHRPARIRRARRVAPGQAVHLIGYPLGLSVKIAAGTTVFESANQEFAAQIFEANVDAFPGNSGSPIFNSETHEVEGILSKIHAQHFHWKKNDSNQSYLVSKTYPPNSPLRQICTRITVFSDKF